MDAKLKIDLRQGTIEVEGTQEFVSQIYADFKERLATTAPDVKLDDPQPTSNRSGEVKDQTERKRVSTPPKPRTGGLPTLVKDLNLAARGTEPSLKDFCGRYAASSAKDWNLLFVYFLSKFGRATAVSQDHIYTCYKTVGIKPPAAFSQSMFDTANKKGWIDTKSLADIKLTIVGENYVDHDFPKKEAASE